MASSSAKVTAAVSSVIFSLGATGLFVLYSSTKTPSPKEVFALLKVVRGSKSAVELAEEFPFLESKEFESFCTNPSGIEPETPYDKTKCTTSFVRKVTEYCISQEEKKIRYLAMALVCAFIAIASIWSFYSNTKSSAKSSGGGDNSMTASTVTPIGRTTGWLLALVSGGLIVGSAFVWYKRFSTSSGGVDDVEKIRTIGNTLDLYNQEYVSQNMTSMTTGDVPFSSSHLNILKCAGQAKYTISTTAGTSNSCTIVNDKTFPATGVATDSSSCRVSNTHDDVIAACGELYIKKYADFAAIVRAKEMLAVWAAAMLVAGTVGISVSIGIIRKKRSLTVSAAEPL